MDNVRRDDQIEDAEKRLVLRAKRMKGIAEVLEEMEVLIDTNFFNEFRMAKSSIFPKKVLENQKWIEMNILKKSWMTLNYNQRLRRY